MRRALLVLGAVLGAAATLEAQQVTARVGGELTAPLYQNLVIPVTVDMTAAGGATLGSYTARLTWSPAALSYYGFVSGGNPDTTAQGNFPPPAVNADSATLGILKFTAVSPAGVGGLVTIGQFRFYVNTDTVPSPVGLSFSEMSAAQTFTNLLPILTVQGATFCQARGRWGDLDRDGASNSRDALIVLSHVVGLAVNPLVADTALADVDADGRATSRDALVILSYAVGMPVPGQRVLLPAAGACGTGSAQQLALTPGALDLAVGQPFRLLPQATDSAGRPVTVPPLIWRSSDNTLAGVDAGGVVTPRAAGTVTITAEAGPGVSASATITVLARRPNWYVDIAATGRPVQNGSAAMPFESPVQAFPIAGEGDTIRVGPGTYAWPNADVALLRGVVIQGGTPGDTTTRPVFRGPNSYTGLWLQGGQRTEVRNVALQAFDTGIEPDGVRNVILEDVKFVPGIYGMYGVYVCPNGGLDTLRIDRTHFAGVPTTTYYGDALYVGGCTTLDVKVLTLRDSRIEYFDDAVYLYGVDSLQILRTVIQNNRGDGLYLSQEYNETPAVHIAHSRIDRNRYDAVTIYDARRIVIDTSVIRSDSADALYLQHDYAVRGSTYLRGDSVYMGASYYDWLDVYDTDSLVLEDLVLRFPDDTVTSPSSYLAPDVAVVRRSRFLNIAYGYEPFRFVGRRFLADSVAMTGCLVAGCDGAYGLHLTGSGVQPLLQVLRSTFAGIYYPVRAYGNGTVLEVDGITADSVYQGVLTSFIDSAAVRNSTFSRVMYAGIDLQYKNGARGPSLLSGNAITCAPPGGTRYGMLVTGTAAVIEHDTITACDRGVELYNAPTGSRVRQSTFRLNTLGLVTTQFFPNDTVLLRVDSNGVSGSTTGMALTGTVRLTNNRLENNVDGVAITGSTAVLRLLRDNAFINNSNFALVVASDTVDAQANWWGAPSTQPPLGPPNGVSGRVDTQNPLAALPNLPGLAPPVFRNVGTARATAPASQRVAADRPPRRVRDRAAERAENEAKQASRAARLNR